MLLQQAGGGEVDQEELSGEPDFSNWLNRKLPAARISVRMAAVAGRREIKRAFILKALCTHELTFQHSGVSWVNVASGGEAAAGGLCVPSPCVASALSPPEGLVDRLGSAPCPAGAPGAAGLTCCHQTGLAFCAALLQLGRCWHRVSSAAWQPEPGSRWLVYRASQVNSE